LLRPSTLSVPTAARYRGLTTNHAGQTGKFAKRGLFSVLQFPDGTGAQLSAFSRQPGKALNSLDFTARDSG
jgi:hypothetical protein